MMIQADSVLVHGHSTDGGAAKPLNDEMISKPSTHTSSALIIFVPGWFFQSSFL